MSSSGTTYVCNGDGASVITAGEPAGANCAAGGVKITSLSGSNYVCNAPAGAAGTKTVVNGNGQALGQFISMYQVSDASNRYVDIVYADPAGVLVPRKADGTLDPFLTGAVWYSMPSCQGTPYTNLSQMTMTSGFLPQGALIQIGSATTTQPNFYKVVAGAPSSFTPASAHDLNGNCGANTTALAGLYTLASVTAPPASVPGPLGIQ